MDLWQKIISDEYLSKEQKAYVDEMQNYLSEVMGEKGNEVSMKLHGIKLFKEKFYIPIRVARQWLSTTDLKAIQEQQSVSMLINAGFSKNLTPNANNPVILSNFDELWANHTNEMSMYHALVLPIEDFRRVFNFVEKGPDGKDSKSVRATIQNAYGDSAVKYINQLIIDINGGAITDPREGIAKKLIGKFKKNAVFASASVVIQQPSAIGRAFAMISPKYFLGERLTSRNHKEVWKEVKKYAPVAIIKEMGYFDTGMGRSAVDYLTTTEYEGFKEKGLAFFKDGDYRDEVLLGVLYGMQLREKQKLLTKI